MSQLLWWAIFVVPTLVALVWALWQAHPADPGDAFHSMAAHRRFVRALSQQRRAEWAHFAEPGGPGSRADLPGTESRPDRTRPSTE